MPQAFIASALLVFVVLGVCVIPSGGFALGLVVSPSTRPSASFSGYPADPSLCSQPWRPTWVKGGLSMKVSSSKGKNGPALVNVRRAVVTRERIESEKDPNKVMVCNLDYTLTERDLQDFCSEVGGVVSAKLVKKRYAKTSKGYGFVVFEQPLSATIAIEDLNGREIKGRRVEVKPAFKAVDIAKEKEMKARTEAWELQKKLEEGGGDMTRDQAVVGEGSDAVVEAGLDGGLVS
ncbi:unnamed protein product [Discosporangium mesarthrocarpum]